MGRDQLALPTSGVFYFYLLGSWFRYLPFAVVFVCVVELLATVHGVCVFTSGIRHFTMAFQVHGVATRFFYLIDRAILF